MITLSYRSEATLNDPLSAVGPLAAHAQAHNLKLGLTGVLLFNGRHFMQTLEGPKSVLSNIFHEILDDERHRDVIPFGVRALEKRQFPHWSLKWAGIEQSIRAVPDMAEFDFSEYRLREIHEELLALDPA